MVDSRIRWPVRVIYATDPDLNFEASEPTSLAQNVEYWNCPHHDESEPVILRDADGRLLIGRICALQIEVLSIDSGPGDVPVKRLRELLDVIKSDRPFANKMSAVLELQKANDDVAADLVPAEFASEDDPDILLLAISLLAGRAITSHRSWLRTLVSKDNKWVRTAASWSLSLLDADNAA